MNINAGFLSLDMNVHWAYRTRMAKPDDPQETL